MDEQQLMLLMNLAHTKAMERIQETQIEILKYKEFGWVSVSHPGIETLEYLGSKEANGRLQQLKDKHQELLNLATLIESFKRRSAQENIKAFVAAMRESRKNESS